MPISEQPALRPFQGAGSPLYCDDVAFGALLCRPSGCREGDGCECAESPLVGALPLVPIYDHFVCLSCGVLLSGVQHQLGGGLI